LQRDLKQNFGLSEGSVKARHFSISTLWKENKKKLLGGEK